MLIWAKWLVWANIKFKYWPVHCTVTQGTDIHRRRETQVGRKSAKITRERERATNFGRNREWISMRKKIDQEREKKKVR